MYAISIGLSAQRTENADFVASVYQLQRNNRFASVHDLCLYEVTKTNLRMMTEYVTSMFLLV